MAFLDMKMVSKKRLDSRSVVIVSENLVGDRIFIEIATNDGRARLERNFPATDTGLREASKFQSKFKGVDDLLTYFGLPKEQ